MVHDLRTAGATARERYCWSAATTSPEANCPHLDSNSKRLLVLSKRDFTPKETRVVVTRPPETILAGTSYRIWENCSDLPGENGA